MNNNSAQSSIWANEGGAVFISSTIRMIAGTSDDWTVITDPAVRFRPARIRGRRYHITPSAPRTGNGSGR